MHNPNTRLDQVQAKHDEVMQAVYDAEARKKSMLRDVFRDITSIERVGDGWVVHIDGWDIPFTSPDMLSMLTQVLRAL